MNYKYFDRDLSWLSFNERVLLEASKDCVPLRERINFLSIFSSNLDEFYRVRMPALMAFQQNKRRENSSYSGIRTSDHNDTKAAGIIWQLLSNEIIPGLKEEKIYLLYNEPIPLEIKSAAQEFFFSQLLAFIEITALKKTISIFSRKAISFIWQFC